MANNHQPPRHAEIRNNFFAKWNSKTLQTPRFNMKRYKLYTVLIKYQGKYYGVRPNGDTCINIVRVSKLEEAKRNFTNNCKALKEGRFKEEIEVFIVRINSKSCPIKLVDDVKWRDVLFYRDIQFEAKEKIA